MARKLVFSPKAKIDIDRIYDYTEAEWGSEQAEKYTFELRFACRRIADNLWPRKPVGNIRKGYFVVGAGSHNIFFREDKTRIVIIRILHNRMDPRRHL